jgi:imidazolonepropionase-like amidohydrolase
VNLCDELLRGAIDLHQHAAPSLFERVTDDLGLAEEARRRGMRGVLIKAHEQDTTGRAFLVGKQVPGVEVFGGVVLNWVVGGLNPYAVDASIKLGARMIWMPTLSAQHHIDFFGGGHFGRSMVARASLRPASRGIRVLNEHGELTAETREILGLIAEADVCLSTGHLSFREIMSLVGEAGKAGVKKILITHPDLGLSGISIEDQKALAAEGAFLEKDLITMMPAWQSVSLEVMVKSIRDVGPQHCVLGTDFGQLHHPSPAEGLRTFIQMLLEKGITAEEVRAMVATNPARLMGLP